MASGATESAEGKVNSLMKLPGDQDPTSVRRREKWAAFTAAVVVACWFGIYACTSAPTSKSAIRPAAPTGLSATGRTCLPPKCAKIAPTVQLHWTPPSSGSAPTGFDIYRQGFKLNGTHPLGANVTSYEDDSVSYGAQYSYQVVALSTVGSSPKSAAAKATPPTPPVKVAQLTDGFNVR